MSKEEVIQVLIFAITNKQKVSLLYKNGKEIKLYEYVLPHLLGIHNKTENFLLSAYFVPRLMESEAEWKTFKLNDIVSVQITDFTFTSIKGYNPLDTRMKKIIAFIALENE